MGRYTENQIFGAEISDGKLNLVRGALVIYGKVEYVAETPEWPQNPPDNWPYFHVAHPIAGGGPFDANLAIYHKGRYHLHYIYRNKWGYCFGHVSSTDMVHWKWHPTTLAPINNQHGMYSGTAFYTKEGKVAHTYCGEQTYRNYVHYALDDNLEKWSKPEVILAKDKNGKLMTRPQYFDPDIFILNDKYYALNSRDPGAAPSIMRSDNLKDWDYLGDLLHKDFDEEKLGTKRWEDISCPNFFKLGDKWVLFCIHHGKGARYFIGDFVDEKFLPEQHSLLGGQSNRLFAPESLETPDGRRVFWAWFRGGGVAAMQSLPTEVFLSEDGFMRYRPIKELEALRHDKKQQSIYVKSDETSLLESIKGNHIEINIDISELTSDSFGINVLCNDQGGEGLKIRVNRKENLIEAGKEKGELTLEDGEALNLRIFVDSNMIEVYANERQMLVTDKKRQAGEKILDSLSVFSDGNAQKFDQITVWQMKSAYSGNTVFHNEKK